METRMRTCAERSSNSKGIFPVNTRSTEAQTAKLSHRATATITAVRVNLRGCFGARCSATSSRVKGPCRLLGGRMSRVIARPARAALQYAEHAPDRSKRRRAERESMDVALL